ncbi:MAG: N-succinyl-L,L-diaminopimelate desuccinylase [uncultured Sphingomonas sp.]|uniref:Succinyl-diaminopimelate desuccinylase n=1 Tax=uncultured Sphingomonas sp. TaxID=158754 RepID=A0A6J4SYZ9_9SPHN|nr:MAG: N-succinyl-L,L-diaminopimelate desuccinylase [uncultured Sphingomonas sp.]
MAQGPAECPDRLLAQLRDLAGAVRERHFDELSRDTVICVGPERCYRSPMIPPIDAVELAAKLISCPSVTPARGEVFDVLEAALGPLGFAVQRWVLGEAPDGPTENLVAIRGSGSPHFGFAGHLDVVPAGEGWSGNPFEARIVDGRLIGRGANDMKSAVAAFVAAVSRLPNSGGTISLLITGDEEGYATYGTPRIIDWLNDRQIRPDMILIGEPTSVDRLGDTVKIGRRGSVNMWIEVPGVQGHVAYPHRATNPLPPMARVVAALDAVHLDEGNDRFPPSNLEFTSVTTPTAASNVIPGSATAQLNIRFNNLQRGEDLVRMVEEVAAREASGATVRARISGEAFLTPPGQLFDVIVQSIEEEAGITPELSTSGGTSDGRFLIALCPVVDFGLPNATMHKLDESAAVDDIQALSRIYERIVTKVMAA